MDAAAVGGAVVSVVVGGDGAAGVGAQRELESEVADSGVADGDASSSTDGRRGGGSIDIGAVGDGALALGAHLDAESGEERAGDVAEPGDGGRRVTMWGRDAAVGAGGGGGCEGGAAAADGSGAGWALL